MTCKKSHCQKLFVSVKWQVSGFVLAQWFLRVTTCELSVSCPQWLGDLRSAVQKTNIVFLPFSDETTRQRHGSSYLRQFRSRKNWRRALLRCQRCWGAESEWCCIWRRSNLCGWRHGSMSVSLRNIILSDAVQQADFQSSVWWVLHRRRKEIHHHESSASV